MNVVALFDRNGAAPTTPVHRDEKGKPYCMVRRICARCGGAGCSDKWWRTGKVCFDCNGSGDSPHGPRAVKLYTAEQNLRLDASAGKRRTKKIEAATARAEREAAEADARRAEFLAEHGALIARGRDYIGKRFPKTDFESDYQQECYEAQMRDHFVFRIIEGAIRRSVMTESMAAAVRNECDRFEAEQARKAAARHVGKLKERVEIVVRVVRITSFDRPEYGAPWRRETVWLNILHDENGNALMIKSPRWRAREGATYRLKATVIEHGHYNDEPQTILNRHKIVETIEAGQPLPDFR